MKVREKNSDNIVSLDLKFLKSILQENLLAWTEISLYLLLNSNH